MKSSLAKSRKTVKKTHIFRVKISHFQVKIGPWRHGAGQNLMKLGWEFSADSEYRIRFFIAFSRKFSFTVLEILDNLWTSFLPFWPKMPKYREPDFFRISGFHRVFINTLYYRFQPKNPGIEWLDFRQKSIQCSKMHIFVLYGWTRFFFRKSSFVTFLHL